MEGSLQVVPAHPAYRYAVAKSLTYGERASARLIGKRLAARHSLIVTQSRPRRATYPQPA